MKQDLFSFTEYKRYLIEICDSSATEVSRGRLANALGCGTSFVSQVLNGHVHFSLEQGMKLNRFLGHNVDESHFFMLLLQAGRAGSKELERYFLSQLDSIREKRNVIQERLNVKRSLPLEDQVTYYSSWIYAASHILLSIPAYRMKSEVANQLRLPLNIVSETLDFLEKSGLAKRTGNQFSIGTNRIHLGKNSPMISKHHANWRLKALESLDRKSESNTHFSVVMGISKKDVEKVRSILLNAMEQTEGVIQKTDEETLFCLGMDLFSLI